MMALLNTRCQRCGSDAATLLALAPRGKGPGGAALYTRLGARKEALAIDIGSLFAQNAVAVLLG